MTTIDDLHDVTAEVRRLVSVVQAEPYPAKPTVATLKKLLDQIRGTDVGPIANYMDQVDALGDQLAARVTPPDPTPTPQPTVYSGFGGSYSGHDPAFDAYIGTDPDSGEWGPHWGIPILAPAPGRVEAYSFPTPLQAHYGHLDATAQAAYMARHAALFSGAVCHYGTQAMSIGVYWPDQPRQLPNGQRYVAAWFGHCQPDIAVGRVDTADRICTSDTSGIDFERDGIPALASHVHTCGCVSGQLTPNGEISGILIAQDFGWEVRNVGAVPGPNDYLTGQYRAGKPLSAWAGHALPPPPQ